MKMRIRHAVAAVAIPVVMSVAATPSFAGILSPLEHEVSKIEKGAVKEVSQVGKEVVKDVKNEAVKGADAVGTGTKATVKFIDKEAAKPVARATIKTTSRVLDETASILDSANGATQSVPIVGSIEGPLLHDAAKMVRSPAAHYGAAAALGLFVGGGGLAEQTAGVGTTTAGRAALTTGAGAATGYYGRQADLAVRCYQDPQDPPKPATPKCTRLKSKP
jgi:hypothetical protein